MERKAEIYYFPVLKSSLGHAKVTSRSPQDHAISLHKLKFVSALLGMALGLIHTCDVRDAIASLFIFSS